MKRKFIFFIIAFTIFLTAYVILIETSPLPYKVIDRYGSGVVSFLEADDAHDVGKRVSSSGTNCVEYFWLKDGLSAYVQCPNNIPAQPSQGKAIAAYGCRGCVSQE
jgi:hypothetical protein